MAERLPTQDDYHHQCNDGSPKRSRQTSQLSSECPTTHPTSHTLTNAPEPRNVDVLFILTVLTASCEPYTKKHKAPTPNRNQRIIKVQGPPHFNHFYGHKKPVRKRPFGPHHGDEFIRPNHPPPIPPFFNGPSTNHIKHPRPPPHVFHKSPSYGLGFPYKSLSSHRPTITKDQFRIQTISTFPIRAASGSSSSSAAISSSTTYHSPKFTASTPFVSPPVSHIISSDDNNGPIREIPAPNLAPKPHDASFGTISVVSDVGGIGGINSIGGIGGIEGVSGFGGVKIHGVGDIGGVGGVLTDVGGGGGIHGVETVGIHGVSGVEGIHAGGIHGVGGIHAVGSLHDVSGTGGGDEISNVASVGGVTHLEQDALLHTVGKNPNGVNLDAIVKDQGLEVNTYIKETSSDVTHGKGPTVEIANFDEGSSIDVTNLIKDAAGTSDHHSGYEVTEHHNHLPSNDQIIKSHDGTKLYYAPDPDPSLPVQKVPPTNDPHSTPSNGQNINNVYLPQISHGFPLLQGGPVGGHLSSQELFHLMHGYPTVISQPVVAFVSQPQAPGVILSSGAQNYYQQGTGNYGGGYSQTEPGNDISQYLQQPDIHNLLHNSDDSNHQQDTIGGSHSSVVSQSVYSPQNQYQGYIQSQYQTSVKDSGSVTNGGNFPTSEINHNYQYEPEASESDNRNSLTVIRQTSEGALSSGSVKDLLLEDSAANQLNNRAQESSSESIPTVLQLKNIPEVPFYASLPSKKAAEALATLQAAGSVANNYMKVVRGDQRAEDEHLHGRRRKLENDESATGEKTTVDIQQSVPLYETSITSKNLVDDDEVGQEDGDGDADFSSEDQDEEENFNDPNEGFGKRLRPK